MYMREQKTSSMKLQRLPYRALLCWAIGHCHVALQGIIALDYKATLLASLTHTLHALSRGTFQLLFGNARLCS